MWKAPVVERSVVAVTMVIANGGTAGRIGTGDTVTITFNQPITPASGRLGTDTICTDNATGTVMIGVTSSGTACSTMKGETSCDRALDIDSLRAAAPPPSDGSPFVPPDTPQRRPPAYPIQSRCVTPRRWLEQADSRVRRSILCRLGSGRRIPRIPREPGSNAGCEVPDPPMCRNCTRIAVILIRAGDL